MLNLESLVLRLAAVPLAPTGATSALALEADVQRQFQSAFFSTLLGSNPPKGAADLVGEMDARERARRVLDD